MLEKPIVAYPYASIIDANTDNEFSFVFSGDYLKQYEVVVIDISDNSVAYQSGVISLSSFGMHLPIYRGDEVRVEVPAGTLDNGKSYYWQVELGQDEFDIFVTSGRTLQASSGSTLYIGVGITTIQAASNRIKIGGAYYPIISYNSDTGQLQIDGTVSVSEKTQYYIYSNTLKSASFSFDTRANPVVTISQIENPHTQRTISVTGTYEQADGTHIKFHRWNLYNNGQLIDTTGNRYHERLAYEFDGLISGNVYFLELCGETQDGVSFSTGQRMIRTMYDAPTMEAPPSISVIDERSSIQIDVSGVSQSVAVDNGVNNTFSTIDGKDCYQINDGALTMDISDTNTEKNDFYVQIKTMLDRAVVGDIVRLDFDDGTYITVSFDGAAFRCNDNGTMRDIASLFRQYTFCLTEDGVPNPGVCYRWDDAQVWDDEKVWTESTFEFDTYVIGISPTACTVEGVDW